MNKGVIGQSINQSGVHLGQNIDTGRPNEAPIISGKQKKNKILRMAKTCATRFYRFDRNWAAQSNNFSNTDSHENFNYLEIWSSLLAVFNSFQDSIQYCWKSVAALG